jgi:anti-anti-sigma factor
MTVLSRPRWVIAELDAHGSIDRHAAMCLSNAFDDALKTGAVAIIIDLRDLSSIDEAGLRQLAQMRAECLVKGIDLELLLPARARDNLIAGPLVAARLLESDVCLCSGLRTQALKVRREKSDDQERGVPLEHRSARGPRARSAP